MGKILVAFGELAVILEGRTRKDGNSSTEAKDFGVSLPQQDEIHLEFEGFKHSASRGGHCMIYSFNAWIEAYKDEDED